MWYMTGPIEMRKEMRLLNVFLATGDRYGGFLWNDSKSYLPGEALSNIRATIGKEETDRADLLKLGVPSSIAPVSANEEYWQYQVQSPHEVKALDVDSVGFTWGVRPDGKARFVEMSPGMSWRMPDVFSGTFSSPAPQQLVKLEQEYALRMQNEARRLRAITEGNDLQRVQAITAKLRASSPRMIPPPVTRILDKDEINASMSRQNGALVLTIYTGLLRKMQSDDLLASVIGHELTHASRGHILFPGKSFPISVLSKEVYRQIRTMEYEADIGGMELIERCGYDVNACIETIRILEQGSPSPNSALLQDHPLDQKRRDLLLWYASFRWPDKSTAGATSQEKRIR
jgi:hypothetical protein